MNQFWVLLVCMSVLFVAMYLLYRLLTTYDGIDEEGQITGPCNDDVRIPLILTIAAVIILLVEILKIK